MNVPAHVINALQAYWGTRGKTGPESPAFNGGQTHKRQPMSVRAIGAVVKAIARKAGADTAVLTPGTLRHTAVKLALRSGKRIEDVKRFARHRYIETTHRYSGAQRNTGNTCGDTVAAAIF